MLPSFAGEPIHVEITAPNSPTLAHELWDSLNGDNKVALFVRYTSLETGRLETSIINKLG